MRLVTGKNPQSFLSGSRSFLKRFENLTNKVSPLIQEAFGKIAKTNNHMGKNSLIFEKKRPSALIKGRTKLEKLQYKNALNKNL